MRKLLLISICCMFVLCGCVKEHTVNFWSENEVVTTLKVKHNSSVTDPGALKKKPIYADAFDYWKTESGKEYMFVTPVTEDIDLYAEWVINDEYVKVVYHLDDDKTVADYVENWTYFTPKSFSREGFSLNGWYTLDGYIYHPEEDIRIYYDQIDLYAYWIDKRLDGIFGIDESNRLVKLDDSVLDLQVVQVPMFIGDKLVRTIGSTETESEKYIKNKNINTGFVKIGNSSYDYTLFFPKMSKVVIPPSVHWIAYMTFFKSNLSEVEFIEGDEYLDFGVAAFESCNFLKKLVLPSRTDDIGNQVFSYSGLTEIFIPKGVSYIYAQAFEGVDNVTIYVESKEDKSTWRSGWNGTNTVMYGSKLESLK